MKWTAILAFLIIIPTTVMAIDENSPELIKLRDSRETVIINRMLTEWNKEHIIVLYLSSGDVNKTWTNATHITIDDRVLYFSDNGKEYIISGVWVVKEK